MVIYDWLRVSPRVFVASELFHPRSFPRADSLRKFWWLCNTWNSGIITNLWAFSYHCHTFLFLLVQQVCINLIWEQSAHFSPRAYPVASVMATSGKLRNEELFLRVIREQREFIIVISLTKRITFISNTTLKNSAHISTLDVQFPFSSSLASSYRARIIIILWISFTMHPL